MLLSINLNTNKYSIIIFKYDDWLQSLVFHFDSLNTYCSNNS